MRRFLIAGLLVLTAGIAGCGGGESTNPDELPPLTQSDLQEIQARDAEIESEEQAPQ